MNKYACFFKKKKKVWWFFMSRYKKNLKNKTWLAGTIQGLESLAKNDKLSSSDLRILFYLLSKIDEDNRSLVPAQKTISDELNLSIRKISEALKKLKDEQIIKKEKNRTYFINPKYFYLGGGGDLLIQKEQDFETNNNKEQTKIDRKTPKTEPSNDSKNYNPFN